MGSNLVVVAIPADDDPVWKVSSEKKPHLTLLFLGDAASNPHVDRIMLFVEHAVQIAARGPFYLEVDHRDVLGPDKADVFMFRKDWSFRWINRFRNQLLQDNDIKLAFESTTQYPEWQPHLTLGYPTAPAHEDKIPDYGISMVRFDRIAVWTGDFEGPEWRLEWPEQQMLDEVAWGVDMDLERKAAGMYTLQHRGVKDMRWDIRKVVKDITDSLEDSMAQSATYGEVFVDGLMHSRPPLEDLVKTTIEDLTHYGIKGMRWGHRKAEPTAVAPHATSRVPAGDKRKTKIEVQGGQNHPAHPDAIKVAQARAKLAKSGPSALSNQELRDVATRIQLEGQVKSLTRSSGHKFVRGLLGQQGKEAANQVVGKQVKKKLATAALI